MSDQEIFEAYKKAGTYKTLYKQKLKFFIDPNFSETDLDKVMITADTYKISVPAIKIYLTGDGLKRYREQFKRFKYNFTSNIVTLKVRQETHDKIMAFASDFGGVDDFLFEYLFDKSYRLDDSKIIGIPSALSPKEQFELLLDAANYKAKEIIKRAQQACYVEGFLLGQSTKKIRSKKGLDAAITALDYEERYQNIKKLNELSSK